MIARPADNPFASRRIDRLSYRFRGGEAASLIERLHRNGNRGAVIGPHGSGKTTLLDHLADRLAGTVVRVRLAAETAAPGHTARIHLPDDLDGRHTVLIDGAEQLGWWTWWRLGRRLRDAGTVVITGHRPGRLPTLHECTTDPELLRELVDELSPETVGSVNLDALFEKHGGNVRLCLRELYDRAAGRESHRGRPEIELNRNPISLSLGVPFLTFFRRRVDAPRAHRRMSRVAPPGGAMRSSAPATRQAAGAPSAGSQPSTPPTTRHRR